eukprot:6455410-Amphidinium_carterae.1
MALVTPVSYQRLSCLLGSGCEASTHLPGSQIKLPRPLRVFCAWATLVPVGQFQLGVGSSKLVKVVK